VPSAEQPPEPESLPLPAIPGAWERRETAFGACRVTIWVPCAPDALLDDAAVIERSRFHDAMPYWAWLWESAPRLARLVVAAAVGADAVTEGSVEARWPRDPVFRPGVRVLELGAGLGLVGLTAARLGCDVTLSDYDPLALAALRANVAENRLEHVRVWELDWRALDTAPRETFDVVLGCDVVYEANAHAPVLEALERFLAPGGEAWIADPGRKRLPSFVRRAEARGHRVDVLDQGGARASVEPGAFRLLVLRRAHAGRDT
jgi:2-polyprenyl-3-methyl-5-hydroxy-6-metoxy-1,4-benzoquinol methylase